MDEQVAQTVERFGGVDILHNSVGVTANARSTDSTPLDTPLDVWDVTWKWESCRPSALPGEGPA
jgi:NAD(P)-dependent dehydrogenase (short-subunit alcohol dehydrogenase family)